MAERKLIATWYGDPARGIFKPNKSKDHATISRLYCSLEDPCPLLQQGKCIRRGWLQRCMYGSQSLEEGPVIRAKGYLPFVARAKEAAAACGDVESWPNRMAYVGDYVYLPYAHMDSSQGAFVQGPSGYGKQEPLPFMQNSALFSSGMPFIKRELFTPDLIGRIIAWRPQALMGGEITSYQSKEVPQFLRDLRATDRPMFDAAVALYPAIAQRIPDNRVLLGKHARLGDLPSGKVKHYSHVYQWDAEEKSLTNTDGAMIMTPNPFKVVVYPHPDLEVELCDPAMVDTLPDDFTTTR